MVGLGSWSVGPWQRAAPRAFDDGFSGFGRGQDERLMRVVGDKVAAAADAVMAMARPTATVVRAVALGGSMSRTPHAGNRVDPIGLVPSHRASVHG